MLVWRKENINRTVSVLRHCLHLQWCTRSYNQATGFRPPSERNQARSKPDTVDRPVRTADTVDRPVRTARTFVHHYNSTEYCYTGTVFFSILLFLPTNITSQMWPSGGKEAVHHVKRLTKYKIKGSSVNRRSQNLPLYL